jgi:hypothetical protein
MKIRRVVVGVVALLSLLISACGGGGNSGGGNPPPPTTFQLTVNSADPASGVAITVAPADNNSAGNGSTAFTRTYDQATSVTLTAPNASGTNGTVFVSWTGCTTAKGATCTVLMDANTTVTATYALLPTVTVTPGAATIARSQSLQVSVTVNGGAGNPTPTGSVTLTSGTYASSATTLANGTASITIPGESLAAGMPTLTATYTPDAASSAAYTSATGMSQAVTVNLQTTVAVNQALAGPPVTDQLLGMNLAAWYDVVGNAGSLTTAFEQAGIKAIRWPGGSWSDDYHWGYNNGGALVTPYMCQITAPVTGGWGGYSTFAEFVPAIPLAGPYDLALTANYGTNETCTGGGDPKEAAAWVNAAIGDGITVSHMTVGNEEYGSWETDMHAQQHDPATYASTVVGTSGYYELIKAASPKTLVGVVVDANASNGCCTPSWDTTVLSNAKGFYDFVEFHYYPQNPGQENDTYLVQQAAQDFTTNVETLKAELKSVGEPDTPIYVGEMGSVSSNPGKQSLSITQGLYAGQMLGEMMNDGVLRSTWWIGFGNCNGTAGNDSSSLYGWQNFGAYNVFADGPTDTACAGAGPIGTMSPTARAFQLFSNIAVNGENALTATVAGETTDVVAYAATHSGGTALFVFNRNQTTPEPVTITLSGSNSTKGITVITYSKAIYDQSQNNVWAPPATTNIGAQSLPLTLTLDPWSMNAVLLQ